MPSSRSLLERQDRLVLHLRPSAMSLPVPPPEASSPARVDAPDSSITSSTPRKQVACQRCKLRKAKCDRQSPKCQRCREAGVPCEYARTRRPPGFPMGHRQQLEDMIRHLEGEVNRLNNSNNSEHTTSGGDSASPQASNPPITITTSESTISQLDTTRSGSGPSANQEDAQDSERGSSKVSNNPAPLHDGKGWGEKPAAPTAVRTKRVKETKPPDDLVLSLTSLYFRHIHHWLPFLDVRDIFGEYSASGEPALITYALFGATLQYSQDPRLTQSSRDAFWKYCKRTIMYEALEEPSYHALEALTILALDLSGMTHGPQVWGVLAVAVKMAQQLDTSGSGHALRTSSAAEDASHSTSTADESAIRRLFWAIYALDCYVALTTRNPSDLSSQAIHNLYPFRSSLWHGERTPFNGGYNSDVGLPSPGSSSSNPLAAPTSQFIFGYQLELLDISKHLHTLYIDFIRFETSGKMPSDSWMQSVSNWSSSMETWFMQLPSSLRISLGESNPESHDQRQISPLVASLNVYYYALRIYLHGMADFMTQQPQHDDANHFANFTTVSRTKCVESLEQMTKIAGKLLPTGSSADRLGWPFAWALWVSGRYCLASRYCDRQLAPHYFKDVVRSLGGLSRYWQVASNYLRLLHISQKELVALHTPGNQKPPSDFLLAVVDWRVASSEVEDRGRVDPILRPSGLAPLEKGLDFYDIEMFLTGSAMDVQPSHHPYMDMTDEAMGDCFPMTTLRQDQGNAHSYALNQAYGS